MKKGLLTGLIVLLAVLPFLGLFLPFLSLTASDFAWDMTQEVQSTVDILGAPTQEMSYSGAQLILTESREDATLLGRAISEVLSGLRRLVIAAYAAFILCVALTLHDTALTSFLGAFATFAVLALEGYWTMVGIPKQVHFGLAGALSGKEDLTSLASSARGLVVKLLSEEEVRGVFLKGLQVGWWAILICLLLLGILEIIKGILMVRES